MESYHPGIEIRVMPKTVRLEGQFKGMLHSAPMEVWVAALVGILTPEQKSIFFDTLDRLNRQKDLQPGLHAKVVADIPMPPLGS